MQSTFWPEPRIDFGPLETGWIAAADLFGDDAAVDDLLQYEATFTRGLDQKGRAAALITEYSHMFAITAVPLLVGHGLVPDVSLANYALCFETRPIEHDGRMLEQRRPRVRFLSSVCWTDREEVSTEPAMLLDRAGLRARFRAGVEDHFRPFVERLHRKSRLSRSALWRLVADSLAALFLDAGQRYGRKAEAMDEGLAILKAPGSPLNNRQLHYFDVALHDERDHDRILLSRTFRARGGCCRYYTAEGGTLCTTCVLKDPVERDRGILDAMRRHLEMPAVHIH
jgi:hypothetical protein